MSIALRAAKYKILALLFAGQSGFVQRVTASAFRTHGVETADNFSEIRNQFPSVAARFDDTKFAG